VSSRVSSVDGRLDVDLAAAEQWVDLAGTHALLRAFNGQVPGPLLELSAGDELGLRLFNGLTEPTNLHFHGLHVPPDGTADNVFLEVPPGVDTTYRVQVPPTHAEGFYWLHPHVHGATAQQVSLGLALPLIIRGALDREPSVAAAREHILVLQDFDLDAQGRPIAPGMGELMSGRQGPLITVSGVHQPRYEVERDGLLRLRIVNASASRFYRLALEDHPLHVIGTDGGPLTAPDAVDTLLLAPGERADVLVQAARPSGTYRLLDLPYDRGGTGMMRGGPSNAASVLATVAYEGRADRRLPLPQALAEVEPLPSAGIHRRFRLTSGMGMMMGSGMGMRFRIDGREFDRWRVDDRVRLDSVEEWEYVNETAMDHPMHVHTNPFQRVSQSGEVERAWRDTIVVPAGGRARLRTRFLDFTGLTVQHCHVLDHADLGMMATVLIE
jgi:FtsP/CotA-like multicopper oxidase with cupredoxin domain